MASIPKKVSERIAESLSRYQAVLRKASERGVNESDTVAIITDILADIFGYDKYSEITSEFEVKGTYCDLAIKIDDRTQFLIEAKGIGVDLKEGHVRQAMHYGTSSRERWVVLTNGIDWQVHYIRPDAPSGSDLVCSFDFLSLSKRSDEDLEKLFILCKEGLQKNMRERFYEKTQSVNRFVIGALILNDVVIDVIRRELKKISDGHRVDNDELRNILKDEVLKQDLVDNEEASKATSRVRRFYNKLNRKTRESASDSFDANCDKASDMPANGSQEASDGPSTQ